MTNTLHAHVVTSSRDCDGEHGRDYVCEMNDTEKASEFSDLEFKERVLGGQVSFHSEFGVEVKVTADGFYTSEQTEEGYRSSEVQWCEDNCNADESSNYDQFAEAMGF